MLTTYDACCLLLMKVSQCILVLPTLFIFSSQSTTADWGQKTFLEIDVRNAHAMVYDSSRGRVVLFGGADALKVCGETWEWDGKQWAENRSALTQGRFNCVLAFDGVRRRVTRFGGRYGGQPVGDTWGYDGKTWEQLSSIGPTARNHTAMVYDSKSKKIILFGGHDFGVHDGVNIFGDTWEWNGNEWLQKEAGEVKKRIDNGH